MKPGRVIVDLAAERGGNCELTQADETVVVHNVTILGPTNLPSEIPNHASQMFGNNITKFLLHLVNAEGEISLDLEDEIIQGCLVSHDGQVVNERIASMLVEAEEMAMATPTEVDDPSNEFSLDDEDLDADMELEDEAEVGSPGELDADDYSDDDFDTITREYSESIMQLADEVEAKTDSAGEMDADDYSDDDFDAIMQPADEVEAKTDSAGEMDADDYSDDDFDAIMQLADEVDAKTDSADEMDVDDYSDDVDDDLDAEIEIADEEDLNSDDEEDQEYDFYKDSQSE